MDGYLGEFPVKLKDTPFAQFTSTDWALYFIERYGGIDGAHHKQWLIDQTARGLNGAPIEIVEARWMGGNGLPDAEYRIRVGTSDKYTTWVTKMKAGEDGPETYTWDEGIAP
jgi:hypothetical protein